MGKSLSFRKCRRVAKGSAHGFDKVPLFAEDKPFGLSHGEILRRFTIRLDARLVALVRSQAVEGDQAPGNVVRPFVRKKVSDEMAAASRNDAAPVFRLAAEGLPLERVDLIANHARDFHGFPPRASMPHCLTWILRLSSKYECWTAPRRRRLQDCRGDRRPGAGPYALLPDRRPCAHQHRA